MDNFLSNPSSPTFHLGAIFQALTWGVSYTCGDLPWAYPLCESPKIYFSIIYNLFIFSQILGWRENEEEMEKLKDNRDFSFLS